MSKKPRARQTKRERASIGGAMSRSAQREAETVVLSQRFQLDGLHRQQRTHEVLASELEDETARQRSKLDHLKIQLAAVRNEAGLPRSTSEQTASVVIADHLRPSAREVAEIHARMPDLSPALRLPTAEHGWDAYLREVELYIDRHGIEVNRDPIAQLLPPDKAAEICRRFDDDFGPSPWDRWDYGAVTLAVLAHYSTTSSSRLPARPSGESLNEGVP